MALALLCIMPRSGMAQGNLLVTPRRIMFENATRVQELTLANIGKDTARYLISIMEIRMKEDGSFEQITVPDSGQQFASKNLRIYPRNVIVAPGASQLVKVQLVKAEQLAPGEYRSHIYVRAVPVEKPLGDKDVTRDTGDISVKLTAIFGLSVPALVRVGENDTRITLSDPVLTADEKTPRLTLTLNRQGQMSSYGDMTVEHIAPDGKVTQVGLVKGIAVYTPNKTRRFRLDLDREQKVDYHTGRLHIAYRTQKEAKVQDAADADLALK
jgi:hypothetical protein